MTSVEFHHVTQRDRIRETIHASTELMCNNANWKQHSTTCIRKKNRVWSHFRVHTLTLMESGPEHEEHLSVDIDTWISQRYFLCTSQRYFLCAFLPTAEHCRLELFPLLCAFRWWQPHRKRTRVSITLYQPTLCCFLETTQRSFRPYPSNAVLIRK